MSMSRPGGCKKASNEKLQEVNKRLDYIFPALAILHSICFYAKIMGLLEVA